MTQTPLDLIQRSIPPAPFYLKLTFHKHKSYHQALGNIMTVVGALGSQYMASHLHPTLAMRIATKQARAHK